MPLTGRDFSQRVLAEVPEPPEMVTALAIAHKIAEELQLSAHDCLQQVRSQLRDLQLRRAVRRVQGGSKGQPLGWHRYRPARTKFSSGGTAGSSELK